MAALSLSGSMRRVTRQKRAKRGIRTFTAPGSVRVAMLRSYRWRYNQRLFRGGIVEEVTRRSSKDAGDAGEYYVAYMLSRLGISAALTTSGTSAVDIIATIDGSKSISIQVKGSWARSQPRQWMVGKHKPVASPDLFYVFCNMSEDITMMNAPEVFIVPSEIVKSISTWQNSVPLFKIAKGQDGEFLNRWDYLTKALTSK